MFVMNGMKYPKDLIASLPFEKISTAALDQRYILAKRGGDYITQLCTHPRYGHVKREELRELQFKAVKQSFIHHYNNCSFYRNYCRDIGVIPDDVRGFEDVVNLVPQIPAETFKKGGILSVPIDSLIGVVTTSGINGNPAYLPRDMPSMVKVAELSIRLLINVYLPLTSKKLEITPRETAEYALKNCALELFTPTWEESSTWLVQLLKLPISLSDLIGVRHHFHLKNFKFDPKKTLEKIKERNRENKMMVFWAFPYIIGALMDYMDDAKERLELDPTGKNLCVMVLNGGWKTLEGKKVDKDKFEKRVEEHFDINRDWIIDTYGFGEANFGAADALCPERRMHVVTQAPIAVTRDPDTLEVQEYGEEGLLSVWDPTMNSYPAFVITDDIVKITDIYECPACGRISQDIEFKGRAGKAELRSCALKVQQLLCGESIDLLEKFRVKDVIRIGVGYRFGDELKPTIDD